MNAQGWVTTILTGGLFLVVIVIVLIALQAL